MQERAVDGVDPTFQRLQVVAVQVKFGDEALLGRDPKKFVGGQQRRLAGPEVGEHQATRLLAGVGALPHPLAERAASRLARLFQAAALHIEQPAMVKAAQPPILQAPVTQISTAVRAITA
jgi:hypothetical protein